MNDDSGETPNPLSNEPMNPQSDVEETTESADQLQPAEQPLEEQSVEQPLEEKSVEQPLEEKSVEQPLEEKSVEQPLEEKSVEQPLEEKSVEEITIESKESNQTTEATDMKTATVESLDPSGRPMEQSVGEIQSIKPAKKTGLIVGLVILLVALIGGGVAAAVLLMNKQASDPVALAMQKIMSGEAPKNVAVDGTINILANDPAASIKRVNIDLDSDIVVGSMINTSSAVLSFTDKNNNDYSLRIEEIYSADHNLFFKIDGATEAIQESGLLDLLTISNNYGEAPTTNCIYDESGMTNCETAIVETDCMDGTDCLTAESESGSVSQLLSNVVLSVIEAADGVYLRLAPEDMDSLDSSAIGGNSTASCIVNLVTDFDKESKSTSELYRKHPFINSTDKNVTLSSKYNKVYKIGLDSKNLVGFMNETQNSKLDQQLYDCLGLDGVPRITESDVDRAIDLMPAIYAEVNSDNNFSRLYLESELGEAGTVTIDLGFNYPARVNIEEPVEYTDFSELIQSLFTSMFNLPEDSVNPTE